MLAKSLRLFYALRRAPVWFPRIERCFTRDYLRVELGAGRRVGDVHEFPLCGLTVRAFSRASYLYLLHEMFISLQYWFDTSEDEPVILDCGANIGMATLFFKLLHPRAAVIAFEPDPATFALLTHNVQGNGLANVTLHNVALDPARDVVALYSDPGSRPGDFTMSTSADRFGGHMQSIGAAPLSRFVDRRVDFLKVDIEGAELGVLQELAQSGRMSFVQQGVIEYHHNIPGGNGTLADLLRLLEDNGFGYQITSMDRPPLQRDAMQDVLIYFFPR